MADFSDYPGDFILYWTPGGMVQNPWRRVLRNEALVYNWYFFRTAVLRKLFDIRFSYKHCNFSDVCLLVKMASKPVTRAVEREMRQWGRKFMNFKNLSYIKKQNKTILTKNKTKREGKEQKEKKRRKKKRVLAGIELRTFCTPVKFVTTTPRETHCGIVDNSSNYCMMSWRTPSDIDGRCECSSLRSTQGPRFARDEIINSLCSARNKTHSTHPDPRASFNGLHWDYKWMN